MPCTSIDLVRGTHADVSTRYHELHGPLLTGFTAEDTYEWFEDESVHLKTESEEGPPPLPPPLLLPSRPHHTDTWRLRHLHLVTR